MTEIISADLPAKKQVYQLHVMFRAQPHTAHLFFKDFDLANKIADEIMKPAAMPLDMAPHKASDEFGHVIRYRRDDILFVVLVDVIKDHNSTIEIGILQAEAQAKANAAAANNPTLKLLAGQQQARQAGRPF